MQAIRVLLVMVLAIAGWGRLAAQDEGASGPAAVASPPASWTPLFDGKSLQGWDVVNRYEFEAHGKVEVQEGCLVIDTTNLSVEDTVTEILKRTGSGGQLAPASTDRRQAGR